MDYKNRNLNFAKEKGRSLSPNIFDDYIKVSDVLADVIDSGEATNIGIISKFGGGKSSFIKTFKSRNPFYKTANVSIANISGDSFKDDIIETIIIKQLIFSRKPTQLPDSRIKRIGQRPKIWRLILSGLLLTISIILLSLFSLSNILGFSDDYLVEFFNNNKNHLYIFKSSFLAFSIMIAIFTIIFIFYNVKSFSLRFKDVEITKSADQDEMPFFKYLDEIKYYFKKTKTRIVFFEDLDRFNDVKNKNYSIFDKLRELNLVLNSNNLKKPVIFVYACGDEVFGNESAGKNKYFDYVFNLEPVLTKENCASVIVKNPIFAPLEKWINNKLFIDRISLYINEMRVLVGIYNDCLIFVKNLNEEKLIKSNPVEIFTLMTYRSLFPRQFTELTEGKGVLDLAIEQLRATKGIHNAFKFINDDLSILKQFSVADEHLNFLTMVLKYNYLTENYKEYILRNSATDSLSSGELLFLKDLNSNVHDEGSFSRKFEDMQRLYSRLENNDFKAVNILNEAIIDDFANGKLSKIREQNLREAFSPKGEDEIKYANHFIVKYLAGFDSPKEPGDSRNHLLFEQLKDFKFDLLKIIYESEILNENEKKTLLTDFIYACDEYTYRKQLMNVEIIQFLENDDRFRLHLIHYTWAIASFDKSFDKIQIDKIQFNDPLIKKLAQKNYIILNKESLKAILKAFNVPEESYLKGFAQYNNQLQKDLYNYLLLNKEVFLQLLLEHKSNSIDLLSLTLFCEIPNSSENIFNLILLRDPNSEKLSLNPRLSATAILTGAIKNIFINFNEIVLNNTLIGSRSIYKNESVPSELILKVLLSDLGPSIKHTTVTFYVTKTNCTDSILNLIIEQKLELDDTIIRNLINLSSTNEIKISLIASSGKNKKELLLWLLPAVDSIYGILFEKGKVKLSIEKFNSLSGFKMAQKLLNLTVRKNRDNKYIYYKY